MFRDRIQAGSALAAALRPLADEKPIILALARGGVPVAVEVARALSAPVEVMTIRKLGAPQNPEFAIGAIAEDGTAVLDTDAAQRLGLTQEQLDAVLEREVRELDRRVERYRDGRDPPDVRGRTTIVVDDGLATGLSDLAAVRSLRRRGATRVVVAAPVGSRQAVTMLSEEADDVVCLAIPSGFSSVGASYEEFYPVSDEEVLALMTPAGTRVPTAAAPARDIVLDLGPVELLGDLEVPAGARGIVIFAHGSGSSRLSSRNRAVAGTLARHGFATLLFDLLTEAEDRRRELVFDIPLLAERLELATRWVADRPEVQGLPVGYFGASTGAGAALLAASVIGTGICAVVSRGGRPDLAGEHLAEVLAPTLLIVGGRDPEVLELNRRAADHLRCEHRIAVVEGAGHLFAEPGKLDTVARLAGKWFGGHMSRSTMAAHVAG
ncbi:MAG TPA: phosphoribosyltransferase family protein [Solirubrobacteraceae bacterium]|jgi:putative phosphoribosyl transferase